jgi:mRNA-degrading endonuclease RelE of RelBE toxin-antitoxin system
MYNLEWMPEARDDLGSLDKPVAQRIFNKLRRRVALCPKR